MANYIGAILLSLAISACHGQLLSAGRRTIAYQPGVSFATSGPVVGAVRTSYAAAPLVGAVRTSYAAAPLVGAVRTSYAAAPVVGAVRTSYAAAPLVGAARISYASAAPAVATVAATPIVSRAVTAVRAVPAVSAIAAPVPVAAPFAARAVYAAQPVSVGVVATAPARGLRTHEVHTSSGRQTIRIEDFQAGDQVVRVHEGPQGAPEVAQVVVPGEQHHVRVVNHAGGPAQVERVVHRQETQFVEVQKPGRPGVRIVQVVKDQSPAPSVEFVDAGDSGHHVYHADDAGSGAVVGGGVALHHAVAAAPAVTYAAAPAVAYAAAPAAAAIHYSAAPVVSRGVAVHHAAAPVAGYAVHHAAAPAATYAVHHAAPAVASVSRVLSAPTALVSGPSYGAAYYGAGNTYGNTVVVRKA